MWSPVDFEGSASVFALVPSYDASPHSHISLVSTVSAICAGAGITMADRSLRLWSVERVFDNTTNVAGPASIRPRHRREFARWRARPIIAESIDADPRSGVDASSGSSPAMKSICSMKPATKRPAAETPETFVQPLR